MKRAALLIPTIAAFSVCDRGVEPPAGPVSTVGARYGKTIRGT